MKHQLILAYNLPWCQNIGWWCSVSSRDVSTFYATKSRMCSVTATINISHFMRAYFLDKASGRGPTGHHLSSGHVWHKCLNCVWSISGHVCYMFGTCLRCTELLRTPLSSDVI